MKTLLALAAALSMFAVPPPTGHDPVGREVLHLVDQSRADPWVPSQRRELMVSMYYPATSQSGHRAGFLTTEEARMLLADRGLTGVVDPAEVAGTRTHARESARPRHGRFPLVVLSPGFSLHRHTQTGLAEDLASRGYVVASIDHAYESSGTAFPGGRVLPCTACEVATEYDRVPVNRARDISFVLDRLPTAWRHARLIDRSRIGVAGHSIGGNAAASAMARDRRIDAGVNMDGTFYDPVPTRGLRDRPFLLLGTPGHAPGGVDTSWDRDWQRLDGWKRWLTVAGTGHLDFCDTGVLADQLGLPDPQSPINGTRAAGLTRAYVGAFFDRHLRGTRQPILDGPVPANPEVSFHAPAPAVPG